MQSMNLKEKITYKWNNLKKAEKSAFRVLIVFFLAVIIFALGTEIGKVFYAVFGK